MFWKNWFTERDNASWCVVRALLSAGGVAMLFQFCTHSPTEETYKSFAFGLAAIGAAIAAKNQSEKQ